MPSEPAGSSAFGGVVSGAAELWRRGWDGLTLLLKLTWRETSRDNIPVVASALAYVTMVSIVPLLAAFSFIGARMFEQFERQTLEFLSGILPYSEQTILDTIEGFLAQAESLRGFALLALLAAALLAFATVERTLNRIWNVPEGRPLRMQLLSFTLLLFWGPILIGISFSGLPILSQIPTWKDQYASLEVLTVLSTMLVLTFLYWLVPYTAVRFRAALAGSAVATVALTALRQGFDVYVATFPNLGVVYGSFALALFFMISINLAWMIVLVGCEVAYTVQHFGSLTRGVQEGVPLEGRWAGLAALVVVANSFRAGRPVVSHDSLIDRLKIPPEDLPRVLAPLLAEGWLGETSGTSKAYLLAADPHRLTVQRIFAGYDERSGQIFDPLPPAVARRLTGLVTDLAGARAERLTGITLDDLLEEPVAEAAT